VRYDEKESDFYLALKTRVEEYFRVNNLNPRDVPQMYLRTTLFLLATALFYFLAFFAFDSLAASWLAALGLGACWTLVAMCITHDGNHGAYSNKAFISKCMGATMDFVVGASSYVWQQQHDYGHHSFTNVDNMDPDIRVNDPDVRRCTTTQPWRWYQRYQHLYLAALYALLGLKAVFADDFAILSKRQVGAISIRRFTRQQFALFALGKLFYFCYTLVLPALYLPLPRVLFLYFSAMCITGWYLAFMFEVAHVIGEAEWPLVDSNGAVTGCGTRDWAAMQVRTTANFCATSKFWNVFSGGLCNQVEHHLFPTVCHVHFTALAPIVKRTCAEFKQPYLEFPTFRQALAAHFGYLKKVGSGEFRLKLA
jgi:acyl-lipid (8-3)-desaturase